MNKEKSYLLTSNYIHVKKDYLEKVALPALSLIQKKIEPLTKTYVFDGKTIQMQFYSPVLAEKMTRTIEQHLTEATLTPDLTVHLWDTAHTEVTTAIPQMENEYFEQDTNTKRVNQKEFFGVYLHGEETFNLYDSAKKVAYFFTEDAERLPEWVSAAPLRTILNWFLSENKIHLIHGATIGTDDKAVLLSAKGGSGKSTTALSCLLSGMDYLADDYIGVKFGESILALNLYNSVKIVPEQMEIFPELKEKIWNTESFRGQVDKGKAIVFLGEILPKQIKKVMPLTAILIPRIRKSTRIVPASRLEAMLALVPTTLFQLPLVNSNKIEELKEIIEKLPCYFLELGPEIREIPNVIKDFIKNQNSI